MRYVHKIDFSRGDSKWEWIWRKLVLSFRPGEKDIPVPSLEAFRSLRNANNIESPKSVLKHSDFQNILSSDAKQSLSETISIPSLPSLSSLPSLPNVSGKAQSSGPISAKDSDSSFTGRNLPKKSWIKNITQKITNLASPSGPMYTNLACEDSK